jgi:FkbM family methyltransferase
MAAATQGMFSTLLRTQQLLMGLGVSRILRKIPLAYPAYAFLYRHWAPRGELCVEAHGHKLFLDPRDMGMARAFLLFRGLWEETETSLFCSLVKEGMTVVDVGANVGYYTLLAARLVGKSGRVFAFEPSSENFALLKRNVEANGYDNVVLVSKAVSDSTGTATLRLDRSSSGGHSLSDFRGAADTVEVETVSLDEYFAGRDDRIDLIKVDAEGAEMAIFHGMQKVLARSPHIVLLTELFPRAIRSFGHRPEDYVHQLAGCGFQIHPIDEDSGNVGTLDPNRASELIEPLVARRARKDVLNLLCLKGNRAAQYEEAVR